MDTLRIHSNIAPKDIERFKKTWEALINTRNKIVPIVAIPTLQWEQKFPTQDGFYWFSDGHGQSQLAYVTGIRFSYCRESPDPLASCEFCGHGLEESADTFPGY